MDKDFSQFVHKFKDIDKEDLIKYFVADKFSHLMGSYEKSSDLNVDSKKATTVGSYERRKDFTPRKRRSNSRMKFGSQRSKFKKTR